MALGAGREYRDKKGCQGLEGCVRGIREALGLVRLQVGKICGGRWTGGLTTLGPSPGSQYSHWFPLGSDLHDQGQASDKNELCSLL